MKELVPFDFQGNDVRVISLDSDPWFVAKDVATILGYSNPQDAVRRHCKKPQPVGVSVSRTLDQQTVIIPESDVYRLILRSNLPNAEAFETWVMEEVLPTIRKTGGAYLTLEKAEEILFNPDLMIGLATQIKELRAEAAAKQARIDAMRPKELFADSVSASDSCLLVGDLAKILNQNGIDVGQNRLFGWLREEGYLSHRKGLSWNSPTQRAMDLGVLTFSETTIINSKGDVLIRKTPRITGKGQLYFVNKFLANREAA